MKKTIGSVFLGFMFLAILLSGCASASTPIPPTLTFTPIPPTDTPVPTATLNSPHSLLVVKSTLSDDLLGVVSRDTDSDGQKLDTLGLGFLCLSQGIYAVDEGGSRLECVQVTDATDSPNQIAIILSGASSDHKYQLVRGEDLPIDLFLKQIAP